MLATLKSYAYGAGVALLGILTAAVLYLSDAARKAREKATQATQRANQERAAREHVQTTVEDTHAVEDDIRQSTADERRDELRDKYAAGPRD